MRRATGANQVIAETRHISIHALHEESDQMMQTRSDIASRFQSTLSMRRATLERAGLAYGVGISIHALHEESDHMG